MYKEIKKLHWLVVMALYSSMPRPRIPETGVPLAGQQLMPNVPTMKDKALSHIVKMLKDVCKA